MVGPASSTHECYLAPSGISRKVYDQIRGNVSHETIDDAFMVCFKGFAGADSRGSYYPHPVFLARFNAKLAIVQGHLGSCQHEVYETIGPSELFWFQKIFCYKVPYLTGHLTFQRGGIKLGDVFDSGLSGT